MEYVFDIPHKTKCASGTVNCIMLVYTVVDAHYRKPEA